MKPCVYVVDDDDAIREAIEQLLIFARFRAQTFASGEEFLDAVNDKDRGCVLLDLSMPGMDGREVQRALNERGIHLPVIFLSGHGDIPTAVSAVKAGAMDFLQKPVQSAELVKRMRAALEQDEKQLEVRSRNQDVKNRYLQLSPREHEVFLLVADGKSSKEAARLLGLSHRTIEVHRLNVMHKMGASNVAELVSMQASCSE